MRDYFHVLQATIILALLSMCQSGFSAPSDIIYQSDFSKGADDWTAVNQATVSDISRRKGGKSLLIKQYNNEEQNSAWLSPVFRNPGKPVEISLWAADNYLDTKDFSFSAAFELVPCDAEGKLTSNGGNWTYIPWDSERIIPQFRHNMTKAGLLWKHYQAIKSVPEKDKYFRLRFCWPKSRMLGECHFTDVVLSVADTADNEDQPTVAANSKKPAQLPLTLEISCADNANLFFADDPLTFDFLLYDPAGKPIKKLANPTINYEITDYENHVIASGKLPFANAETVKLGKRDTKKRKRSNNLHVSATIPDKAAKEVGREFFLKAELLDGSNKLAEDIVTYGVVNPRQTKPEELDKARFIAFAHGGGVKNSKSKHDAQFLSDKMGISLSHDWDYSGWKKAQPNKNDAIKINKGPDHPKLVYCPNLEQVRGRKPGHPWGDMSKMAPAWAVIDDPLRPGCKTFDIDAYVKYIVQFVRTNRHRIVQVVPSGLERTIDARTLELQRKVYKAIKKEFPDLPVGMMVWGVLSEDGRKLIMKEKLYDVSDFFDTHVYLSAVDWTEWEKLQKALKKMGKERPLITTEFARVGGTDQLQRARDLITSNLDAHAHGMYRVTNFLMYVGNRYPVRDTVLQGAYPGDGFQWMQYVDRPRVSPNITDTQWRNGSYGRDTRGTSLMPMLHTMSYYNLVQNVECADFKTMFKPTDRSIAYVYERDGKTILYLYLNEPADPITLQLSGTTPYTMQDLYGRKDHISPVGSSLVIATLDPLAVLFDKTVPELYKKKTAKVLLKPVDGGIKLPVIARGAQAEATIIIPPVFGKSLAITVEGTVDGRWPDTKPLTLSVKENESGKADMPIAIPADKQPGSYLFTTRLYDGKQLISVLKQPLQVSEVLTLTLNSIPMTRKQDPAITVTVTSLADKPMSGTIQLSNRYFGTGLMPATFEKPYQVAPRSSTIVSFPVPRGQVNLASSYLINATLRDKSGITVTTKDDVSFQACEKTKKPIVVDGNLSDWDLENILPIPFERWCKGPRDPNEFSGKFYTRWDDSNLYFAAVITDSVPVVTGEKQVCWNDDNIMFCIYPWRWHMGQPLNTGYYREHLGPIKVGGASFMRCGYVPSGPSTAEGAQIAVKRTKNGWIYEWAYPKQSLYPIELKPGGGFRLSMSVWDQHQVPKKGWGEFSWLTFAGFNTSVNAQPDLWRQFTMVE